MGALKDNMISEMKLRNFSDKTIEAYTLSVQSMAKFYNRSPLLLTSYDIKNYFLYMLNSGASPSKRYVAFYGIRLFYSIHKREYLMKDIKAPRRPFVIPPVLDQSEIQNILMHCNTLRYRAIFSLIYSAGLRISEAVHLRITDIDFKRNVVFVNNSKDYKSRLSILSSKESEILKRYIHRYQPTTYLFFNPKDKNKAIQTGHLQNKFRKIVRQCGYNSKYHVHTLRHSFATHLLENNTSVFYIMKLLGHSSIKSTMIYLHMQRLDFMKIVSPLDTSSISLDKNIEIKDKQLSLLCA